MSFRTVITPRALGDLRQIRDYIALRSPENAAKFLNKLLAELDKLERQPRAFARAPEDELVPYDLHQYVIRPYRILYRIRGKVVEILHVRHGARRRATRSDLD